MLYNVVRNALFAFDPEAVHYFSMNGMHALCKVPFARKIIAKNFTPKENPGKDVFGLHFRNPVGLGAGFDKNALYLNELDALGFGFVEIGTVTPVPQPGNEQPRLFRLPKDKALINRMGFNNNGVKAVAARTNAWRNSAGNCNLIVGGNIGKNKQTPNEDAWKDFEICFNELFEAVDYFTVNVSSPNTPGLRALQEKDSLSKILGHLQSINSGKSKRKPLLLKIAPDLEPTQLDDIIALSQELKLDGLVATNTTITRNDLKTGAAEIEKIGAGGLSGKPLKKLATNIVSHLAKGTCGSIPIVASGGIFSGKDAEEKMRAGASLVQVWTGFIYEGPSIVKNICRHLS